MTCCASTGATGLPEPPRHIDIILPEGAAPSSARMLADLFRAANEILPGKPYRISVHRLSAQPGGDPRKWQRRTVIFMGDIHKRWPVADKDSARIHRILSLAPRTVLIGGAVFLLGDTGLAQGRAMAVHPNFSASAREEGMDCGDGSDLTTQNGCISTAISAFAALPVILELIAQDHGAFAAHALGTYLGLKQTQPNRHSRLSLGLLQKARGDRLIDNCLSLMQAHIEQPMKIGELARHQGVSTRKLQRRFLDLIGEGPLTIYRALRIERAQQLLVQTSLPLSEIILATGFGTHSNLARWVRKEYGVSPQTLRQQAFRGAA